MVMIPFSAGPGTADGETETIYMLLAAELTGIGGSEIQLLEPPRTEALLSEQMFQLSGFTVDEQVMEFGRRMNANLLLTGFCALFDDELTVVILVYETETGQALSGRIRTIRQNAFLSDISLLGGEIWADLYRIQRGIDPEEIDQLLKAGDIEEALRFLPLLDATGPQAKALTEIIRERIQSILSQPAGLSSDQMLEMLYLLLTLTPENNKLSPLADKIFALQRERNAEYIKNQQTAFQRALKDQQFDEAAILLEEMRRSNAEIRLIADLAEELKKEKLESALSQARSSLLRGSSRTALYHSREALQIHPLDTRALDRTIQAQRITNTIEMADLMKQTEPSPFSVAERHGISLQLSLGFGATDDTLALLAKEGTGISAGGALYSYREILPPLHREFGFQFSWANREGGLTSSLGSGLITIETQLYEATASLGGCIRFYSWDFGLRIRGGAALIISENETAGSRIAGSVLVSPEFFVRRFWRNRFYAGAEVRFSNHLPFGYSLLQTIELNLGTGWSF